MSDMTDREMVELERIDGNPLSTTRRAIVRAAAEIGKQMP